MKKPAVTQAPIHDILANRWSGRAYDNTRPVSRAQTLSLLEAARWAPSCYGDQPWRFVVWNKNEDNTGWQMAFDTLAPGNQGWVKDAQLLVLSCADTVFTHNGHPNRHAQYDTGAAAENLCLQAEALGLMAHQMGGFDAEKMRAAAAVPAQFTLMAMISIGYPADPASFSAEVAQREMAERKRRELGELFFAGTWGKPAASSS